jgi:hypothetical protein
VVSPLGVRLVESRGDVEQTPPLSDLRELRGEPGTTEITEDTEIEKLPATPQGFDLF